MMTLNERIREFIADTEAIVTLPDMDQRIGYWGYPGIPKHEHHICCFGARVARALCQPKKYGYDTDDGHIEMRRRIGLQDWELGPILYACGTGISLFHWGINWKNEPHFVYEKFVKIKRKPTDKELHRLTYAERDDHRYLLPKVPEIYDSLCDEYARL